MARSKKPTPSETPDAIDGAREVTENTTADEHDTVGKDETGAEGGPPESEGSDGIEDAAAAEDNSPVDEDQAQAGPEDSEAEPLVLTETLEVPDGQPDGPEVKTALPEEAVSQADADAATPPEPDDPPAAPPAPLPAPPARSGAIPLFLGGVAAAALGFVVARYAVPEGWPTPDPSPTADLSATVEDQAARIAALEERLTEVTASLAEASEQPQPDLSGVRDELRAELLAAIPDAPDLSAVEALQTRITELTAEVAGLADNPAGQAPALTDEELAAFRSELDAAVTDARSQIEAAQAEAARIEAEAAAAAARSAAEAALSRIGAALESGAAYGEALTTVSETGAEIPAVLAAGADGGVPTLPALQDAFPDAARSALEASILATDADSTVDRALAFLRAQTGARSLTPREGDDPDAILSRAEAALRSGDLSNCPVRSRQPSRSGGRRHVRLDRCGRSPTGNPGRAD